MWITKTSASRISTIGSSGLHSSVYADLLNAAGPPNTIRSATTRKHSTKHDVRKGLIKARSSRDCNGIKNTRITHADRKLIRSKHITMNATGRGFLTAPKQSRHLATDKRRIQTAMNSSNEIA